VGQFLGIGTIGTVFEACNDKEGTCAAIKMCELTTPEELRTFEQEVRVQTTFASYGLGPQVFTNCTVKASTGRFYSVIIMEKMGQELDEYLTPRRSKKQLDHIISQLEILFSLLQKHKITHGDLALFNIAFNKYNELKFIDYDRASTSVYDPGTDLYRLQSEFNDPTDTTNTKPVHEYNRVYLLAAMSRLTHIINVEPTPNQNAGSKWYQHYRTYCKTARIACLDDDDDDNNAPTTMNNNSTVDLLSYLRQELTMGRIVRVQHITSGNIGTVTKVTK
jgi:tRNA A-37 threonylcarbamoyl transferase component Bud32